MNFWKAKQCIVSIVALVVFLGVSVREAEASYAYWKMISVNSGQVSGGPLTNFPLLFSVTDANLKTAANGGHLLTANGWDIAFKDSLGNTLNYEIELYNGTTGQLIAWVQVPTIANGTNLFIQYGDASIAGSQQNAAGVWDSNYKGVWHLPNGSVLSAADSTGINSGAITGATAGAGQIDGSGSFSGSSQYIDVGADSSLGITGDLTIEAWVNPADFANYREILGKTAVNFPKPYDFYLVQTTGQPRFYHGDGTPSNAYSVDGGTTPSTGTWSHIVVTLSGTTVTHYLNGASNGSGSLASSTSSNGSDHVYIGSRSDFYPMFKGGLDEVRISNNARTAGWILTEYNNQKAPGSFYTVSGESTLTPGTSTTSDATQDPFQRKTFYANGRYWVFYSDGTSLVWQTSTDGITWGVVNTVRTAAHGFDFSVTNEYRVATHYVHYAVYDSNAGANQRLYYRRGTLNVGGTITWTAEQQAVARGGAGVWYYNPMVAVDDSGYPWIGYLYSNGATQQPYVTACTSNTGVWVGTLGGFPQSLNANNSANWRVHIVPLTSGKMGIIYSLGGGGTPSAYGRVYSAGMGVQQSIRSKCRRSARAQRQVYVVR